MSTFSERLKALRKEAGLTQQELANAAGVTLRTIQNYEHGERRPGNMLAVQKIAEALNTTTDSLLGVRELVVLEGYERGGARAARDIDALVSDISAMFAGGELSAESMDGAMRAISEAYWIAKENNKKYTPKKYLKDGE